MNHQDLQGRTALIYAIVHNNELQIINSLLDAGVNVHLRERYKGITPLSMQHGEIKILRLLQLLLEGRCCI